MYWKQVIGNFLFYDRAIDSTMLTWVGYIATHLSTDQWENINIRINHFLNYAANHPDAKLIYYKATYIYESIQTLLISLNPNQDHELGVTITLDVFQPKMGCSLSFSGM